MNREEERKIAKAWLKWSGTQSTLTNEVYMIFVQTYVRNDESLRALNVFEVLDVLVNAEIISKAPMRIERDSRSSEDQVELATA